MDWSGCELVEVIPGKMSGAPLVIGTRIPADVTVSNFKAGSPVEEIEENYPSLPRNQIEALLSFAQGRQLQRVS